MAFYSGITKRLKKRVIRPVTRHVLRPVGHVAGGTGRGLYHGVTGVPTGIAMTGRIAYKDIRHDLKHPFLGNSSILGMVRGKKSGAKSLASALAKAEYESYRHFGRGGDVSGPLMDALAVLSAGGGAAARIGAAGKAARAVRDVSKGRVNPALAAAHEAERGMKGPMNAKMLKRYGVTRKELDDYKLNYGHIQAERTNTKSFIRRTEGGANLNRAYNLRQTIRQAGKAASKRPAPRERVIPGTDKTLPASPNPAVRGIQKATLRYSSKAREGALKRVEAQTERFHRQLRDPNAKKVSTSVLPSGRKVTTTMPSVKQVRNQKQSLIEKGVNAPMDIIRMSMWLRPRYYLQNLTQTGTMLAHRPAATGASIRQARHLKKNEKSLYNDLKNIAGEGQALSLNESRIGGKGKFVNRAGRLANAPEAHVRILSTLNALRDAGYTTHADVVKMVNRLKAGKPTPKDLATATRANEEVGDFGRLSHKEQLFMKSQVPIFYPMFKALLRYGYRFPAEHSIQAAAGLAIGKKGKEEQNRLLGDLPFWAQYLVPKGAGDPNAKPGPKQAVFNPSNIYNLQPAAEVSAQGAEMFRRGGSRPGLSILQEIGPAPGFIHGAATGRDIQTGYPLRHMNIKDRLGNVVGRRSNLEAEALDFLTNLPLSDLWRLSAGIRPPVKSYEEGDLLERLMMELGPGPAFFPRTLLTKETGKQAKREKKVGKVHRRKKARSKPRTESPFGGGGSDPFSGP